MYSREEILGIKDKHKGRKYKPLYFKKKIRSIFAEDYVNNVLEAFQVYLLSTFKHFRLIDEKELSQTPFSVQLELSSKTESKQLILKKIWDLRADSWMAIESPYNYVATMHTLLGCLKHRDEGESENILSLGSDPGIYETFLAGLFNSLNLKMKIWSLDFSHQMGRVHREVKEVSSLLDEQGNLLPVTNLEAVTGDMVRLPFADNSIDQIICNNSLQWVPDWRAAVREMARVMNPKGLGWLYLFVHHHRMTVQDEDLNTIMQVGFSEITDLMDFLNETGFEIHRVRLLEGKEGTGQFGGLVSRAFILAQYNFTGKVVSWRSMELSVPDIAVIGHA